MKVFQYVPLPFGGGSITGNVPMEDDHVFTQHTSIAKGFKLGWEQRKFPDVQWGLNKLKLVSFQLDLKDF
ncbi:hypothetical protein GUJ93_ZPchr0010g9745 [Zizania palustris]|uniref:Uncharacterized protein n=1 Tax=Zizania palustris TaxID=103762 RepID=A0A8J5WE98_ZIZPA|nr:hypothetical protein GUJ93_ZPchr0010g9745 [Zizania palustris]